MEIDEVTAGMSTKEYSAYQKLQAMNRTDLERREHEARMKALRDHNQFMLEARERGKEEVQEKMIKSLFRSMSVEEIAKAVDMPVSYIKRVIES